MQQQLIKRALARALLIAMSWVSLSASANNLPGHVELTADQEKWLIEHPDIRLGVDADFYPMEYIDNQGNYLGISADIFKLINAYLDSNMRPDLSPDRTNAHDQITSNQYDIFTAVSKTKAREKFLLFSKPYELDRIVIVTKNNFPEIKTESLMAGQTVYSLVQLYGKNLAVTSGHIAHLMLLEDAEILNLMVRKNTLDALEAVISGEADAAIVTLDIASPLINAYQLNQLKINNDELEPTSLHIAVRKDWPELLEIINTSLAFIGSTEIDRIVRKWRTTPILMGVSQKDVWLYGGLLFLLVLVLSVTSWAYHVRRVKLTIEIENQNSMDLLVKQSRHVVMGEMIAMLTHQWRQPLTAMMLSVGTIKMQHNVMELSDSEAQLLNTQTLKIEDMMATQVELLNDFKNFFHPIKEQALFNITNNVQSVLNMLNGYIVKYSIKVTLNIPRQLEIDGFERDFRHVLINLITNAVDQIKLNSIKDPIILVTAGFQDGSFVLTVEDNAGGIDDSVINNLFEPYVSTKSLNGTGLGLYMVKRMVEESCGGVGGTIVASNTIKGAKFTITMS
jgi:signal transduction histidine kinase